MKVVQLLGKAWLETTVLFSSIAYLIIRIVADVNKINLPIKTNKTMIQNLKYRQFSALQT